MVNLKNKKHLFFDFDDTLWDFQKNSALALRQLFDEFQMKDKLGADFNMFEHRYKVINQDLWKRFYNREIDKHYIRNERFNLVFKAFDYHNYEENLRVTELYLTRAPRGTCLKEGCLDTLDYLKKNYQLHIITNGFTDSQRIKIEGSGLKPYFTQIIISEEYQLIKPEEKIFRLAESFTRADRSECVMIGDSLESDIDGAVNAGWEAIYFSEHNSRNYPGITVSELNQLKNIF